jgi:hypothetical protein
MSKTITDKIDKYLVGEEEEKKGKGKPPWLDKEDDDDEDDKKEVDENIIEPSAVGIKPGEYNNISTGLRRIQFRLEKANTPQKYVDAFEVIQQLMTRFPLKAKVIWQTVANMYQIRFGSASAPTIEGSVEPE